MMIDLAGGADNIHFDRAVVVSIDPIYVVVLLPKS